MFIKHGMKYLRRFTAITLSNHSPGKYFFLHVLDSDVSQKGQVFDDGPHWSQSQQSEFLSHLSPIVLQVFVIILEWISKNEKYKYKSSCYHIR